MASSVNSYATLTEFKAILGVSSTTDDIPMRKILEAASRAIESYCNRRFYCTTETKYFDGALTLWIPDLLSVPTTTDITLKTDEDGDGTYENTFDNTFATGDFILYGAGGDDALNLYPKVRIEINPNGDYGSFANGVKKGVQIAGVWGYGDGTTATPYVADTTTGEAIDIGETTITVTSGTNLSAGHTILVETEQMYITSVSTNDIVVEKGVNGTTDAAHTYPNNVGKQIYYYRYPRDIYQACIDLSVALYQNRGKKGIQSERLGDYSYTMSREMMNSILEDSIRGYRRMRV